MLNFLMGQKCQNFIPTPDPLNQVLSVLPMNLILVIAIIII